MLAKNRKARTRKTKESLRDKLIAEFPEASKEEIALASRPRYRHFTSDGRGNTKETFAPAKDGFFNSPSEGRAKGVMPKKKKVKLKQEFWPHSVLISHFRSFAINANSTSGWFVTFKNPGRKMTTEDQLTIFLAHTETEYLVHINRDHCHLVIENLNGE